MKKFSLIQRFRNKLRIDKSSEISIGKNVKIVDCSITIKGNNNTIHMKDNARLRGAVIEIIGNDCLISIGKNSMIGDNCYLTNKENGIKLIIGDNCGLSRNIKIMTSDGHPIYRDDIRINNAKDVVVEDNVWIADNVTILKGVHIGSGSVVGINSTVVKDVPEKCIAVGNPAKIIKENIVWKDKF